MLLWAAITSHMQLGKVFALGIATVPILLTLVQWVTFRIARRARQEAGSGQRFAWTIGRLAAFGGLIGVGLVAFPAALYALILSFLAVPWPISWPAAAALFVTGVAGVGTALFIFSNSPARMSLIRLSGLINIAVLAWSSLQLTLLSTGPPDWFQPGITDGAGRLEKRLLLSFRDIGNVTDIEYGDVRGTGAVELSVAGNYGARFFSKSLQPQSSVDFDVPKPYPTYSVDIVPKSRANLLMFFRHSNWSEYDSLFGADGRELWRTPHGCLTGAVVTLSEGASPDLLCVQDSPECCSLEARNVGNTVVWNAPVRWVFNLAFLGPSATPAIVIDQPGTDGNSLALMGLDPRGQTVFTRQPVVSPLGGFSAIHWPGVCEQCLLVGGNDEFSVVTPDGTKIVKHLAPAIYVSQTQSVAVRLTANRAPMLAVIGQTEYKSFGEATFHGVLFVFDASGRRVYSEVFPEEAQALAAMPTSGNDSDVLLVGGENKIWEYSAREL